jgi:protein ImuA
MVTFGCSTNEAAAGIFTATEPAGSEAARLRAAIVSGGQLQGLEAARPVISSGFAGVDALLPVGGLRRGSLVEWLVTATGCGPNDDRATGDLEGGAGAATLAFAVACRLAGSGSGPQTIVVVDRTEWFHPPAVLPWLTAGQQLVVARPGRDDDEIWAIDQALRCGGVAAVVAWPRPRNQARQRSHWTTALRRWQLAARSSGGVGLLVRPQAAARDPSWAEARIAVEPLPGGSLSERRLRLTRVGGGWIGTDQKRSAETALDLAQGSEALLRPASSQGLRPPRRLVNQEGGVACRAS